VDFSVPFRRDILERFRPFFDHLTEHSLACEEVGAIKLCIIGVEADRLCPRKTGPVILQRTGTGTFLKTQRWSKRVSGNESKNENVQLDNDDPYLRRLGMSILNFRVTTFRLGNGHNRTLCQGKNIYFFLSIEKSNLIPPPFRKRMHGNVIGVRGHMQLPQQALLFFYLPFL
jgi:hypothetical protein